MAKANLQVEMTADDQKLFRQFVKLEAAQRKLEAGFKKVGTEGRKAGKQSQEAFGSGLSSAQAYIRGIVGIGTAIAALKGTYATWQKNIRATSDEARKASNEIIAFAALQAGGTKAQSVRQAAALAARFGIVDRGEAFNTVQAIQSARGGSLEAGLAGAETVFAATQVGIPIEAGRELEVLGASQGQKPGQALRRAFVAGQLSAREPATLAKAAAGLTFFDDKNFGFAAAGVLAGSVKPDQLQTFVKAAGLGLSSDVSKEFAKTFKTLGLTSESTQFDRLRALAGAGLDTVEKLGLAGLGDLRRKQAIANLVTNLPDVERFAREIPLLAIPGVLTRGRAEVEAELPATALSRRIDEVRAKFLNEQAFGPQAIPALQEDLRQRELGLKLIKEGRRQFGPFSLQDEEGRTGPVGEFLSNISRESFFPSSKFTFDVGPTPDGRGGGASFDGGALFELSESAAAMRSAAEAMGGAARNISGGPAMVPVTEDR